MWFQKKSASEVRTELTKVYPKLWRYCITLTKSRDLADDLAQQACSRALEKAHLYKPGTHFDRWIFRIAHRVWINELRKSAVRLGNGHVPAEESGLKASELDAEMNILGGEVLSAVMALPHEQRSVVFLAYVEGYTYKECAEMLEIPLGTVMSRLAAVRTKMSKKFVAEGSEQ